MGDGIKFHTPNVEGGDMLCKRLSLPSSFWRFFYGAYGELCEANNWLQVGDMTPFDASQVFIDALDNMRPCNMVGSIIPFFRQAMPENVLPCTGQEITAYVYDYANDRRLWYYEELWNAVPDNVKSEGAFTGTIQLPDLRDKFILAAGTQYAALQEGGEAVHTLTTDELPSHAHEYTPPSLNLDIEAPGAPDLLAAGIGVPSLTSATGGNQPHNNMPPFYSLVYGIVAK